MLIAALIAVLSAPVAGQDARLFRPFNAPVIAPAAAAPDCEGETAFAGATCLAAPAGQTDALLQAYADRLYTLSWIEVDGSDRRRAFVRRRDGGGCDGLQMLAVERGDTVLLVFATTPGDACAAPPSAGAAA